MAGDSVALEAGGAVSQVQPASRAGAYGVCRDVLGSLRHNRATEPPLVHNPTWVRGRQAEVSPSYCRLLLSNLSTIPAAAVDDGLLAANPCDSGSVRPLKVNRARIIPWTVDRVQKVLEAHHEEFAVAPLLGAACGMRQGEIFGLDVDASGLPPPRRPRPATDSAYRRRARIRTTEWRPTTRTTPGSLRWLRRR